MKNALIEGVSALEVSLDEYVRRFYVGRSRELILGDGRFDDMRLPVKMALIAGMVPALQSEDIDDAISVIEQRNDLVHEGKALSADAETKLRALFRVVAALLEGPKQKLPSKDALNRVLPDGGPESGKIESA
jgi:hypothetical protein